MADSASAFAWTAIVTVALGSSVVGTILGKIADRSSARAESVRSGYADATKALNAWAQFPLRISRRVDDDPETLYRLETLGAGIKENLAYATGWVGAESREVGRVYNQLVELLRAEVTVHARLAWASPPAATAAGMNVSHESIRQDGSDPSQGVLPAEWVVVQLFSSIIHYRIGWRRYLWFPQLLRWRLARLRLDDQAENALRVKSARLLNWPAQS
jgi:hypothetical protein